MAKGNKGDNSMKKLALIALLKEAVALVTVIVKRSPEYYQRLKSWWNGKCIAIIGPTASGKNSFFNRLKREDAPIEHIQTRGTETIDTFKFVWPLPDKSEINFRCKGSC